MLMAVSSLSPVSTHVATPARLRSAMARGTPICSLSSMAVEPRRVRSRSISSSKLSIRLGTSLSFFSSSTTEVSAARYFSDHAAYAVSSSSFSASTSVRRPSLACPSMSLSVFALSSAVSLSTFSSPIMMLSAPLESSLTFFVDGSDTMTDMRFRAEVNSSTSSRSNVRSTSLPVVSRSLTTTLPCCLLTNSMPKCVAAATSADSSGDDADRRLTPSISSTTTVWQRARSWKKLTHASL
mmetsp:Transcript_65476/g.129684  ORF Transcript_65476/g.129684 Transcript_65476/m.129684 type:complete len:239 (-) Transcript_65476:521-1237(-)